MNPLARWSFYALLVSLPFELPQRSVPFEVPTAVASVFLGCALLQAHVCFRRVPWAFWCFLAYLPAFGVAVVHNPVENPAEVMEVFLILLQSILVFWAAYNLMRYEGIARVGLAAFGAACVVRAILPLVGVAKTAHLNYVGGERITAFHQNPNNSAMILAAGLVILIGLTQLRPESRLYRRVLVWPFAVVIGVAILGTGSRGGLLALGVGLLAFALGGRTGLVRLRNMGFVVVAIGALIWGSYHVEGMRRRFEETAATGKLAGREHIYPALVGMFLEAPVFGWGPVNNKYELALRIGEREKRRRDTHNLVLELLTATGLIGAIPVLIGLWLCGWSAWRARRMAHGVLPLALLTTVLAANMSGNRLASKLLWLVLAYSLASSHYTLTRRGRPQQEYRQSW